MNKGTKIPEESKEYNPMINTRQGDTHTHNKELEMTVKKHVQRNKRKCVTRTP